MAQREPKSRTTTSITIVGRDGSAKGELVITSGNLAYTRTDAKSITGQWTLQQLVEVLERDLADRQLSRKRTNLLRLAKGHDFKLTVTDIDGSGSGDAQAIICDGIPLRKFDEERKLQLGEFTINDPKRIRSFGFTWSASISVVTALYVLDLYVRKWLRPILRSETTNSNVPVSKAQLAALLRQWLADIRG